MDHRFQLVAAALFSGALLLPSVSMATYAQAIPPSGWGGSASGWTYSGQAVNAANAPWVNGRAAGAVTVNVGGKAVQVPAAWRMASNAPRIGAAAVRAAGGTVAWALGSAVLPWLAVAGIAWAVDHWVVNEAGGTETCWNYSGMSGYGGSWPGGCFATPLLAAQSAIAAAGNVGYDFGDIDPQGNPRRKGLLVDWTSVTQFQLKGATGSTDIGAWRNIQTRGSQSTHQTGATTRPAIDSDWDKLAPPVGDAPPEAAPALPTLPIPLPVDLPVINPPPGPLPLTGPLPIGLPLDVPVGAPVPVPGTNPQKYDQPAIGVQPHPTPASPWQVDLTPKDIIGTDPNGLEEPATDPNAVPPEEQPGLCEEFPNASACKPLGAPADAPAIAASAVSLSITPLSGFGPSTAACPAPRVLALHGLTLSMPFDLLCQFADGIRPIIVGLAWLAAVLSFMGLARKGD